MDLSQYIEKINERYQLGNATEHTYRTNLEKLLQGLEPSVQITNEPKRVTDCGNPDFVISRGKIPIGFIETKDLNKNLNSKQYAEQFGRYRRALDNLIITDYLYFQFFQHGKKVHEIRIGKIEENRVKPLPEQFNHFRTLITDFCTFIAQTIKSPKTLAKMMAGKARLLENILENAITCDEKNADNSALKQQYEIFKKILIHDLSPQGFADIYAQTLAYGMFAARLQDKTLDTFSRQEAAELIPKSNPFLRKLFSHVAGVDIDKRILPTVDNLADVFRATNVEALLKNFGKSTQTQEPIIHFYETFLAEYDPKLKKTRGVWYTPAPVVDFMVRSVDDILKTDFGLTDGLADTTLTSIKAKTDQPDRRTKSGYIEIDKEVHKVQILDPATGTGTFLAEVVKFIYNKKFAAMQGAWSGYVEEHLIPRLNGFELLMAAYSMAHLKMGMLLTETGYRSNNNPRFNIFLTNSLEEHHPDTGTLFSSWLSTEANEANNIKRDTPVMVIIGNPPYSGESANKGQWIMDLMEDYKKEPEGKEKLKERNPKWINDDYVKFVRYGQHFIEKNGEGVLAYINPHGFLDNPTFRGMRWHLLNTYDKIYTIDLHGNSKKKEVSPDGSADVNVFDIQQGVSINFFIKTGKKKSNELAQVFHHDLYGTRESKYHYLQGNSISQISFEKLPNIDPMYFMVKKDFALQEKYDKGFKLNELFSLSNVGMVTARDSFTIHSAKKSVQSTIDTFLTMDDETARNHFQLGKDVRDWQVNYARKDLLAHYPDKGCFAKVAYRPFDTRWTFFTGKSKGFHCYPRTEVMQHFLKGENVGLVFARQSTGENWTGIQIVNTMIDNRFHFSYKGIPLAAPLYLYPETKSQPSLGTNPTRSPNLDENIVTQIAEQIDLTFIPEKSDQPETFAPIDLLDYIYAVLHSPNYREKYKEFLKIDFPRVPYPNSKDLFFQLAALGAQLRALHLLEFNATDHYISTYPETGDNEITNKIQGKDWELYDSDKQLGRIWINPKQYFSDIPLKVWEFYIGGYQPAQKWLKDRKGEQLSFDDILHYQKIIIALNDTISITQKIDQIDFD
jgi:predicted helicase